MATGFGDDPGISGQRPDTAYGNAGMVRGVDPKSGMVPSQQITFVRDDHIPEFLNQLVEPYVKRKQDEMFYKGMTDQMTAGAETEMLDNNGSWVDSVFGPTAYREGATAFKAMSAVSNKEIDLDGRMDDLKRLPPEELSKVVAHEVTGMMTGDKWTDAIINREMTKKIGPMLNTVAKARLEQQQFDARQAHTTSLVDGAAAYQITAARQASLTNPSEAESASSAQAQQNFFDLMPKPYGMTDQAYRQSVKDAYGLMLQQGNFFAAEAIRGSGLLQQDTDVKDLKAMDEQYDRYADKANDKYAAKYAAEYDDLAMSQHLGEISPPEMRKKLTELNERIRRETGIQKDYMSPKEIDTAAHDLIAAKAARALSNQDKLDAAGLKREENEAAIAAAGMSFRTGQLRTDMARGLFTEEQANAYAIGLHNAGDFHSLVSGYTREGWSSPAANSLLQQPIANASVAGAYTKDAERGFKEFQQIFKESPAAAQDMYGKYYLPMLNLQRIAASGTVDMGTAWTTAFPDLAKSDPPKLPDGDYKKAGEALNHVLDTDVTKDGNGNGFLAGERMLDSSRTVISRLLSGNIARAAATGNQSYETMAIAEYRNALGNGSLSHHGKYAWTSPVNTPQLSTLVGPMQPKEFNKLLYSQIDESVAAHGFRGAQEYTIRTVKPGTIAVVAWKDHRSSAPMLISADMLRARHTKDLKTKMQGTADTAAALKAQTQYGAAPGL